MKLPPSHYLSRPIIFRPTRARVTQILNLAGRAPDIQQALLDLQPTTDTKPKFRERELRQIAVEPNWSKQRTAWKRLVASKAT